MDPTVISWSIHLFSIYYWWLAFKVWNYNNSAELPDGMYASLPASMWIAGTMATIYTVTSFGKAVLETYGGYLPF